MSFYVKFCHEIQLWPVAGNLLTGILQDVTDACGAELLESMTAYLHGRGRGLASRALGRFIPQPLLTGSYTCVCDPGDHIRAPCD